MNYDNKRKHTVSELVRFYYERIIPRPQTSLVPGGYPEGVDVSHWNGTFDPDLSQHPIEFAFQKITEGTSWTDPSLDLIWSGVAKVGVRGAYHYIRSGQSWTAQVGHFLSVFNTKSYHVAIVDLESNGGDNVLNDTLYADTRRWIDAVRSQTSKPVLLYTSGSIWTAFKSAIKRLYADGQAWLDGLDFWYAWPSLTATEPAQPCKIWQYRWDGKNYGTKNVDVNRFIGTLQDLYTWAGVTQTPPPDGGNVTTGLAKEILGKSPSVRDAPSVSGNKLYSLPPYSVDIEFIDFVRDLNGVDWWLDLGAGKYVNLEVAGVRYLVVTRMPVVDPPPVDPPAGGPAEVPFIVNLGDDVTYYKQTITGILKPVK